MSNCGKIISFGLYWVLTLPADSLAFILQIKIQETPLRAMITLYSKLGFSAAPNTTWCLEQPHSVYQLNKTCLFLFYEASLFGVE